MNICQCKFKIELLFQAWKFRTRYFKIADNFEQQVPYLHNIGTVLIQSSPSRIPRYRFGTFCYYLIQGLSHQLKALIIKTKCQFSIVWFKSSITRSQPLVIRSQFSNSRSKTLNSYAVRKMVGTYSLMNVLLKVNSLDGKEHGRSFY